MLDIVIWGTGAIARKLYYVIMENRVANMHIVGDVPIYPSPLTFSSISETYGHLAASAGWFSYMALLCLYSPFAGR